MWCRARRTSIKTIFRGARFAETLRPEQHRGEGSTRYGRLGHIPGSTNVAAADLVNADNTFKSPDELRHRLAGPLATPKVITYCGGGISCVEHDAGAHQARASRGTAVRCLVIRMGTDPSLAMATGN